MKCSLWDLNREARGRAEHRRGRSGPVYSHRDRKRDEGGISVNCRIGGSIAHVRTYLVFFRASGQV